MVGFNREDENLIQFLQKQQQSYILKLDKTYNKIIDRIYPIPDVALNKNIELMIDMPEYTSVIFNFKTTFIPKWYQLQLIHDRVILYLSDNVKQIYNFPLLAYNILNQRNTVDDIILKKYFNK